MTKLSLQLDHLKGKADFFGDEETSDPIFAAKIFSASLPANIPLLPAASLLVVVEREKLQLTCFFTKVGKVSIVLLIHVVIKT